eukprot:TRINITY_DN892_c0_g3_i1.p1 TRINITY_DN892_c0_g3~~TRINITY_DN892_c0_g3_i1.p1  ORF type:complete len:312 (+),score=157.01 TRINITY_DN892_c0_g3_i1:53-937(+)
MVDAEVSRVFEMLTPKPNELLIRGRYFIREGEVSVYNAKERKKKPRYFFLFNDLLLLTKKEGRKKFWLKVLIILRPGLKVQDVLDSSNEVRDVEFRIYAPKKTFIIFALSPQQKREWLSSIQRCLDVIEGKIQPNSTSTSIGHDERSSNSNNNSNISSNISNNSNLPRPPSPIGQQQVFIQAPQTQFQPHLQQQQQQVFIQAPQSQQVFVQAPQSQFQPQPQPQIVTRTINDPFNDIANFQANVLQPQLQPVQIHVQVQSQTQPFGFAPAPTTKAPFDPFADDDDGFDALARRH